MPLSPADSPDGRCAVSLLIVMGPDAIFRWRAPATLADLALGSMLRAMLNDPTELDAKPRRKPKR
jgi:hypothetical protein